MTAPSHSFSPQDDDDRPNVVQRPVSKPRTAAIKTRYLSLWTGFVGQLSFRMLEVWSDCIQAVRQGYGLAGWRLHAGPTELIWEIHTSAGSPDLRQRLETAIEGRMP